MGLVTRTFTYSAGAVIIASQFNTNENTLYNLVNGLIDNENVASGAAIAATKLNLATIAQSITMSGAAFSPSVQTLTDGATPALDAATGNVFKLTAAGNRTIAVPTNPTSGQKIVIIHVASGADRTLSLNSGTGGFRFGTSVSGLTATTSAKTDYIGAIYNAADNKWDVVAYVKTYG